MKSKDVLLSLAGRAMSMAEACNSCGFSPKAGIALAGNEHIFDYLSTQNGTDIPPMHIRFKPSTYWKLISCKPPRWMQKLNMRAIFAHKNFKASFLLVSRIMRFQFSRANSNNKTQYTVKSTKQLWKSNSVWFYFKRVFLLFYVVFEFVD